MSKDIMTPEAVANLHAYRRRKAEATADRIDRVFFNRNPSRTFHIRATLEYERLVNDAEAPAKNACLMMARREMNEVDRIYFQVKNLEELPDEEQFLVRFWVRFKDSIAQGRDIILSPVEHKNLLIATGNWKEPHHG